MNNHILDDVMQMAGNISLLSVALIILITLVGAVLMIALCNGGLLAVRRLWHWLFGHRMDGGNEHESD